jgi:hypothetical protein
MCVYFLTWRRESANPSRLVCVKTMEVVPALLETRFSFRRAVIRSKGLDAYAFIFGLHSEMFFRL